MAFTQAQVDAVKAEIVALEAASFSLGGITIDQEKTLATLKAKLEIMERDVNSTITFGQAFIGGIDA